MSAPPVHPQFRLSKSRFLSGLQCLKRLYLEIHSPDLASEADDERQAVLDMGKEVGEVARLRFPNGQLVEQTHRQTLAALRRTEELVQDSAVQAIFEGAFQWEGILVRVDILERVDDQAWRLIEVKASSKVKSAHCDDLAIQTVVLRGAGINLVGSYLMHLNTQYVYQGGALDFERLFSLVNMTEIVNERVVQIDEQLQTMRAMLERPDPPAISPDGHCHTPYECPFWEHCTMRKGTRWIYHLPGNRHAFDQLQARGVESIDDIPTDFPLTTLQQRMKNNVEWVSPELLDILKNVQYPVHHLDFETFMPAIPLFPKTRSYRPIPVQWSNHIEYENGTIRHETYLCTDPKDPREDVAQSVLASLGSTGNICVYSEYERHVLLLLAELFPTLKSAFLHAITRLWDLLPVIQRHYYHPDFNGSFSIKSVLPALLPTLHYDDLDIRNGAMASIAYRRMVFLETDLVERARIATSLHEYCKRDTLAMLEIRRVLFKKASQLSQTEPIS